MRVEGVCEVEVLGDEGAEGGEVEGGVGGGLAGGCYVGAAKGGAGQDVSGWLMEGGAVEVFGGQKSEDRVLYRVEGFRGVEGGP